MDDDSPWLSDEEQSVWRQWLRVTGRLPIALHEQLQADSDLSFPDFEVLSELSEVEHQRLRVTDLARALQWERSRLSHHVKRMEARGLVRKQEHREDRRGAVVVLTPRGRAALERAAPGHARTVRALLFDVLASGELGALERILVKVEERLRAAGGQPDGEPGGGVGDAALRPGAR